MTGGGVATHHDRAQIGGLFDDRDDRNPGAEARCALIDGGSGSSLPQPSSCAQCEVLKPVGIAMIALGAISRFIAVLPVPSPGTSRPA